MKFHKNFHVVALFAAIIALNAQAASVSPEQVTGAVSAWAAANGSAFANLGEALSAAPEYDTDGTTKLYYKVKMSNGGTVIASPDTDLELVVAVLENSVDAYPKGHPLPSILKADMRNRLSVISRAASAQSASAGTRSVSVLSASAPVADELPENVKASISKANAQWAKYNRPGKVRVQVQSSISDEAIAPYIRRVVDGFEKGGRFTHWNQSEDANDEACYNLYTPKNVVCGCVATAGAAIMQFFGCSEDIGEVATPDGDVCYLYGNVHKCKTIAGKIDWSILPAAFGGSASSAELDDDGRRLLGQVTYNLGVLTGMGWATEFDENDKPIPGVEGDESGASLSDLVRALKAYGFESARAVGFGENADYFKMIYAQNWAGAPVALSIGGDSGGHAVIACGYAKTSDEEEYCRVFMGWGGFGDAWYKFPAIHSFSIVNSAITMIGYDASKNMDPMDAVGLDEAAANAIFNKYGTVPVVGKANVTNTVLTLPGVTKSGGDGETTVAFTNTVPVDASGYFATRIPVGTTDLRLVHEESKTEYVIKPFDSKVLKNEDSSRVALEAAMPSEIAFLVLYTASKPTVESAYAKARDDGKALLMISSGGSMRADALLDYITYLDRSEETKEWMSANFVIVRVDASDRMYGDGDPAIGVFDPVTGSPDFRWWKPLAYENFIDCENSADGIVYTYDVSDPSTMVNMTNAVDAVLRTGLDTYLRLNSGISVTVRAIDMDTGADISGIVGALPEYGSHGNCWTNGETVVFCAPLACTNLEAGISYSCIGWTTNGSMEAWDIVREYTNEVSLATNDKLEFSWLLKVKAYSVTSAVWIDSGAVEQQIEGAISPLKTWRYPGERITIVATNSMCDANGLVYGLDEWVVRSANGAERDATEIAAEQNGTAFSFTVDSPVSVLAKYREGEPPAEDPEEYSVSISMNPADLANRANTADSSLALGANTTYDPVVSPAALSSQIIDATGGVWVCTGWVQDGVTNSPSGLIELSDAASTDIELVWEIQEPATPPAPEPGPVSVKGLSRSADGEWSISVEGAVKGCWYSLYAADDISKLSGPSEKWTADKVATVQASTDGEAIVFKARPSANAQFWRVKATGTNE